MRFIDLVMAAFLLFFAAWPSCYTDSDQTGAAPADTSDTKPAPPMPEEDRDPCKNVWLYANGSYHHGSLRFCQGSAPMSGGSKGGWVGDGLWPPQDPPFISCQQGTSFEIVVPRMPVKPVRTWIYEWKEGMTFSDRPRELQHTEYPASLRTIWPCTIAPGRYLLTVYVHWPGMGTERSFGLEVK